MSTRHDLESHVDDIGNRARRYADDARDAARGLVARSRRAATRFNSRDYSRRLSHAAEDFADEANYQYRRLRRQVNRHPAATVAIVAGTIGAFLLLRRAFRSDDDE